MSDTIKLLEWKASNTSQYFSTTTNILSFDEAVDALPEEAEEYIKLRKAMRKFNGQDWLGKFDGLMFSNQCDATLRTQGQRISSWVVISKRQYKIIENHAIWLTVRQFMKNGSTFEAPFTNKREQIKEYLESVSESLLDIANKFKEKEKGLINKMMETTNKKNRDLVLWYVLPSLVVFIFTIVSIYTTRFNPKLRSSLVTRTILNSLFYIVAIHVVIVFIYELVSTSDQCQPDPQLLNFSEFKIPSFNKSSRTITTEDFLNCTATRSHIFAAPNDEIFIPTTFYDDYFRTIPSTIIPKLASRSVKHFVHAFRDINQERGVVEPLVPQVLSYMTPCEPLREFKEPLEQLLILYKQLGQSLEPFGHDLSLQGSSFNHYIFNEKARLFFNKGVPKMQNAIVASIRNYNDMINDAGFDCSSMSDALQHGFNRTCYVVNGQLVSIAKLVLIGISVIAIITHILTNRKYETVLEKSNSQQNENQTNV